MGDARSKVLSQVTPDKLEHRGHAD
jgi:hypothetical protein